MGTVEETSRAKGTYERFQDGEENGAFEELSDHYSSWKKESKGESNRCRRSHVALQLMLRIFIVILRTMENA